MIRFLTILIATSFFTLISHSDQAGYVSKKHSEEAVEILNRASQIWLICPSCSNNKAQLIEYSTSNNKKASYKDYWEVLLDNDRGIDLAYVYFKEGSTWKNLALSLNIKVYDVKHRLTENELKSYGEQKIYEDRRETIESNLNNCLKGLAGNIPMANCTKQSNLEWDTELNRIYVELMNSLPEESKIILRSSQRNWIKFRDSELAYIDKMYSLDSFRGTMYYPIAQMDRLMITKKRVNTLYSYHSKFQN